MDNFDIEEQIGNLGLERIIGTRHKPKILDIGCGRTMKLARYIQDLGFEAEGLDSAMGRDYPGSIRQKVTAVYPQRGCIPKEEGSYDLVLMHQNPVMTSSLTCLKRTDFFVYEGRSSQKEQKRELEKATKILSEALRVNKKDGGIVIYPAIDLIEEEMQDFVRDNKLIVKFGKVEGVPFYSTTVSNGSYCEDISSMALYRALLYRQVGWFEEVFVEESA